MGQVADRPGPRRGWVRAVILLVGVLIPQAALHGRACLGLTYLYPLDLLALPGFYLPRTPEYAGVTPRDHTLSDLILEGPYHREFTASEYWSGRVPLWSPYNFLGAPYATWAKYSPFELITVLFPCPEAAGWVQVAIAVVAGAGAYVAFRRLLGASFWPAAVGAWCYPLTGYFVLWAGFPMTGAVAWLPWVLVCTDAAVRRPMGWGGPALALVTALTVFSRIDAAAQVLLISGLYAVWTAVNRAREAGVRAGAVGLAAPAAGWAVGLALTAIYVLPFLEYTRTGARMQGRSRGVEERPPVGLHAAPLLLLPEVYGTTARDSLWTCAGAGNWLESAAPGYAGLLAALFLAPLGWSDPRHRRAAGFFTLLAVLGAGWQLNLPVLTTVGRLPLLNMLSHNRFVFATGFAVLSLAVLGLDALRSGEAVPRWWFWVPALLAAGFGLWCLNRAVNLPEPVASRLAQAVRAGRAPGLTEAKVAAIQAAYRGCAWWGAGLAALAVLSWLGAGQGFARRAWWQILVCTVLLVELFSFARGAGREADPRLYFPRLPALERLTERPPGRILGFACLPPNLNYQYRLYDVRGYDGVDPARFLALMDAARAPTTGSPPYARTQYFIPDFVLKKGEPPRFPPILDLFGVRYVIFRRPAPRVFPLIIQADDYWIAENPNALPRAFVPRAVVPVRPGRDVLPFLRRPTFDPRATAYVEGGPSFDGASGSAAVVAEHPQEVRIDTDMRTGGLVVLADLWDPGWRATVDGEPAKVRRVNAVLRGVTVPAGRHEIVYRYEPASFTRGVRIAAAALIVLMLWTAALAAWARWRSGQGPSEAPSSP